jgi:hypothetical protein
MAQSRKKPRVYIEKAKRQHTTHWDMDYLSDAEVNALYGIDPENAAKMPQEVPQPSNRLKWIFIFGVVGVMLLASALLVWQMV